MLPTILALVNILVALGIAWAVWRVFKWRNARADAAVALEPGAFAVAVRELRIGSSRNGLWPKLTITSRGIRFKVLLESFWAFSDIKRIDVYRTLFGGLTLSFTAKHGTLDAQLANHAAAQDALLALPSSVPLTPRAVAVRDGTTEPAAR